MVGYDLGQHVPGSNRYQPNSNPYQVGYDLLSAHARVAHLYQTQFYPSQCGQIGMTNSGNFRYPLTNSDADREAAQRSIEFQLTWLADPVFKGEYLQGMRDLLGDEVLPVFTPEKH
uniref:Uncharacterized protein n=1 Tax=Attheya septentrionalis TaxID=420275 RepID=A0A7S2UAU1_9STRA|mmetsp:Transcript_1782/g.3168  ORF Transcript_1782/g.3168 Transcript_1782/m.3168 type:complete len:116 (+) Transcript_1782:232-579(+)